MKVRATLLVALLSGSGIAMADFPGPSGSDPWLNRPNDPRYPTMWQLYSHMPPGHRGPITDAERSLGAGMHVDRAWQLHTGTPETLIAVLDSGINWDELDLVDRHYLNTRELPSPAGATSYDANGDGRVSISDYRNDPRVHDANGNGILDAGDLIRIFSDGRDDDGNGYVDDIAGWDFHEHDNDPGDRTRFGHGTGEALDSTGALNNGIGHAGICGNCTFMAVRVNDSFVVDANAFSDGVIYAVDQGASLVQQALGAANSSEYTQEAVNYAYDHEVVIIGSAADENSYHHNYPSTLDPVIYTNSIRYDTNAVEDASTFVAFNSCSNFGARVDVATPGRSCSSEATANLAGTTGLAWSYAKSLGRPLSAGEMISLIKVAATDIALGDGNPEQHATYPGWDAITGYGRSDAFAMLERIRTNRLPPEARIVSPRWFAMVGQDPTEAGIQVAIQARSTRTGGVEARLEVARGVETSGATFVPVATTPMLPRGMDGVLATIPFSLLESLPASALDKPYDEHSFTIRLVVRDATGESAEARRTIFYHREAAVMAGYPRDLGGSGESAGVFYDLNGDGRDEYVMAGGSGFIHAFTSGGNELPGFPAAGAVSRYGRVRAGGRPLYASVYAPVAVGDLDGDGRVEIVTATMEGHVVAVDAAGRMRPGFPVTLPFPDMTQARPDQVFAPGVLAAPVLADLDGDGRLEIVVAGLDGLLHVLRDDGGPVSGFPVVLTAGGRRAKLVSSPAVTDVDGDGIKDMILGSNHDGEEAGYLFAVRGNVNQSGTPFLAGFPARVPMLRDVLLPTVGTGIPTAPVVADFDGDGDREVLIHAFVGKIYIFGLDGRIERSLSLDVAPGHETNDRSMLPAFGHPAAGVLVPGEPLSPVAVGAGPKMLVAMALGGKKYDFNHMVGVWNPTTGRMREGFPKALDDMALGVSPLVVDIDGDGRREIVAGSGGYYLHAYNQDGELPGYPLFAGGWIFGSASAGDMDGDGRLELAATTREGYLMMWKTAGPASERTAAGSWMTFKGNAQRTGEK